MPSFQRRHYVEVARILHDVRDPRERQRLAEEFARMFRDDNSAFDVERFSSAVYGNASGRAREPRRPERSAPAPRKADAGFAIDVYPQDLVEENARDKFDDANFHREVLAAGFMTDAEIITEAGWNQLNEDISRIETNAMAWMRKTFISAREDGHDSHDDLVGSFWFDPGNPDHAHLVDLAADTGRQERIDMVDLSYGDLASTVLDGVSDFGASVLGGSITFFDVKPEDMEVVERSLERERKRGRR